MDSKFLAGLTATVAFTGLMAHAGAANALVKTYTTTFDLAPTDITDESLLIQKFDSSLGVLEGVTIGFDAQIVGNAQTESLDAQAQTLTFNLLGDLTLVEATDTLDNPLFAESVSESASFDATAFDGAIDFGGTSGQTFAGLTGVFSGTETYSDQAILDFFTGGGDVEFLFSAATNASVTGAANLASIISTQAAASVTVSYNYSEVVTEDVPEPSALLGLGLVAGVGMLATKKYRERV
ncbi:choice-of-anchor E domain-containing protein [Roseofilum casamattae]|uniref:Choice-of-anchor E domain-containing protein n=1 Tax=Roseofilum casamattae BLCC-M143 TaxID=3022442 RepID=A0ABT7BX69_9CYAN|nr:choice-of-anchor E domain-containing protein [Roseofilum casamattae]MDJ1183766.1 choice-of-anchor E domain-containing protein [Roseofilum casamattae BLCC-M143]